MFSAFKDHFRGRFIREIKSSQLLLGRLQNPILVTCTKGLERRCPCKKFSMVKRPPPPSDRVGFQKPSLNCYHIYQGKILYSSENPNDQQRIGRCWIPATYWNSIFHGASWFLFDQIHPRAWVKFGPKHSKFAPNFTPKFALLPTKQVSFTGCSWCNYFPLSYLFDFDIKNDSNCFRNY